MGLGLEFSFLKHLFKSVHYYRLTAVYLVAGVALTTANIPFTHNYVQPTVLEVHHGNTAIPVKSEQPVVSIMNVAYHVIAGWFSFLGALWDVRRRMIEWALIRLYGGHPSLVAGLHYAFLSLVGTLIGGGFALLTSHLGSLDAFVWFVAAILGWGLVFSTCIAIGPVLYTEFCDLVAIFRIEGS